VWTKRRTKIKWSPFHVRQQKLYDDPTPTVPALDRLWRCVAPVRNELAELNRDQSSLDRGNDSLNVEGVIYAIYCVRTKKVYVGQTMFSSLKRFQGHVGDSLRGTPEYFHRAMRSLAWRNFAVFPLEVIPASLWRKAPTQKARLRAFTRLANSRERFWIDRLHTYYPRGYNSALSTRKRRRRGRVNNPMKWKRALKVKHKGRDAAKVFSTAKVVPNHEQILNVTPTSSLGLLQVPRSKVRTDNPYSREDRHVAVSSLSQLKAKDTLVHAPDHNSDSSGQSDYSSDSSNEYSVPQSGSSSLSNLSPPVADADEEETVEPKNDSLRWYGSRDPLRRCKYLVQFVRTNNLDKVQWREYATKNLTRMKAYLEYVPEPEGLTQWDRLQILRKLRGLTLTRYRPTKPTRETDLVLYLRWNNHSLQRVPIKNILNHPEIVGLLPSDALEWDSETFMVTRMLGRQVRGLILNYKKVALLMDRMPEPSKSCPCRKLFPSKFRPSHGCVLTGDTSIVENLSLKTVLEYGPQFRDYEVGNPMIALREGLLGLIEKLGFGKTTNAQLQPYRPWMEAVLERCTKYLPQWQADADPRKPMMDRDARKALSRLQQHLTVVCVDKASSNVSFICKRRYCAKLRAELDSGSQAYEKVEVRSSQEIIKSQTQFLTSRKLESHPKLPFLYYMPKFHKQPVGARFIAAASRCTTARLSKVISSMLMSVLRVLRELDNKMLAKSGIRRFFVVDTFEEVSEFLTKWRRDETLASTGIQSGDFSTMYTAIPHEDLFEKIGKVLIIAFRYARAQLVQMGKLNPEGLDQPVLECTLSRKKKWPCEWTVASSSSFTRKSQTYTLATLNELIRYLVSNTYLANGSAGSELLYRQVIGLPMGTNCAPSLANLYLHYYERLYITNVKRSQGLNAAQNFHMTFRLIDDVMAIDNPLWAAAVSKPFEAGGMYPEALQLNDTTVSDSLAEFIGINVQTRGNKFHLSVYDKRKTFPFEVRRYPRMCSLIPSLIPYNVFISQCHRVYRICSGMKDFVASVVEVAVRSVHNGCRKGILVKRFKEFVAKHVRKYPHVTTTMTITCFRKLLGSSLSPVA
jgi:hypothetical protein